MAPSAGTGGSRQASCRAPTRKRVGRERHTPKHTLSLTLSNISPRRRKREATHNRNGKTPPLEICPAHPTPSRLPPCTPTKPLPNTVPPTPLHPLPDTTLRPPSRPLPPTPYSCLTPPRATWSRPACPCSSRRILPRLACA